MRVRELIDQSLRRVDWRPTLGDEFTTTVLQFVNTALSKVYNGASFLFKTQVRIRMRASVSQTDACSYDRLGVDSTDNRILFRTIGAGGHSAWKFDGRWDARWVMVTSASGRKSIHRIREIWAQSVNVDGGIRVRNYMTIEPPYSDTTATGLKYTIYDREYPLPVGTRRILRLDLAEDNGNTNQAYQVVESNQMPTTEAASFPSMDGSGVVALTYHHFDLPSPTVPPKVGERAGGVEWVGPDNPGKFQYAYTYCWGVSDEEGRGDFPVVTWESALSPLSDEYEVEYHEDQENPGSDHWGAVEIKAPNIDHQMGYAEGLAIGRSGVYVRFYVVRNSVKYDAQFTRFIEAHDYPAQLDEGNGFSATIIHDGSKIADRMTRPPSGGAIPTMRVYPSPSADRSVVVSLEIQPPAVWDLDEQIAIDDRAVEAVILYIIAQIVGMDGASSPRKDAADKAADDEVVRLRNARSVLPPVVYRGGQPRTVYQNQIKVRLAS